MAGTRFQVKTYGANIIASHFRGLARRAADLSPAQPAIARRAAAGYQRSFERQGPGWKPHLPSTDRRRIKEGFAPGPILVQTGGYKRAATNPLRLKVEYVGSVFTIEVDHPLARWHQSGTHDMVARPLKLSTGDRYWLLVEINNSLMEGYRRGDAA